MDRLSIDSANSTPSQVTLSYHTGLTKDLKTHVKFYAFPKDAKWTVNKGNRFHIKCGNGIEGVVELKIEGAPQGVLPDMDIRINGQQVPLQLQAPEE